jgi:uncharacterized membrane protein
MSSSADATAPRPSPRRRFDAKLILWSVLGAAAVWVFFSNEVALMLDYPLYHSYRLQMALDRALLIPHAIFGSFALIAGTLQFSSRLRQRRIDLHRLTGRSYVVAVYGAALTAIAISWDRPLMPATLVQGLTWILVTTVAWLLARNGHIAIHRQWVARSYAMTFTFVSLRVLSIWPAFWNLPDPAMVLVIIITTLASVLGADLITSWREISKNRK